MSSHPLLPIIGEPRPERSDAARNRAALLEAATRLIGDCGISGVTMEAVAAEAGVGKGTVFRRFESREGLMAAVLDRSETTWQGAVLSGPPPLGPGAPPMDRLLAFGHSRARLNLLHADLIVAAGRAGARSYAAISFAATHVRYLLSELGVTGDEIAEVALRYVLSHPAVSTVIPGMRSVRNVERNMAVADGKGLAQDQAQRLKAHRWVRNFYA